MVRVRHNRTGGRARQRGVTTSQPDLSLPRPTAPSPPTARTDASFDEFFTATWPRLYRTAYAVAGDHGTAEDALQNAFARAFSSWRRVSRADRPEAYVRRMVVNDILDQRRSAFGRRERPRGGPAEVGDLGSRPGAAAPRDETGDLVTDQAAVWAAVLALPPRQRAVVVLRYYEDLSEREIAQTLGCSLGTVKSQASAALATLRRAAADLAQGDAS